jgi:HK97 family phage prohead protease
MRTDAPCTIEGYAAVYGVPDLSGDIVRKGAFDAALARAGKLIPDPADRVIMLYQHAAEQPIGTWAEMRDDAFGLWVRGEILTRTEQGRAVAELVRNRIIDGLSIGFKPRRSRRLPTGQRELLDIDLWEISIVTFPMAAGARIRGVDTSRQPRNLLTA